MVTYGPHGSATAQWSVSGQQGKIACKAQLLKLVLYCPNRIWVTYHIITQDSLRLARMVIQRALKQLFCGSNVLLDGESLSGHW